MPCAEDDGPMGPGFARVGMHAGRPVLGSARHSLIGAGTGFAAAGCQAGLLQRSQTGVRDGRADDSSQG